jgi:hypothetical protein
VTAPGPRDSSPSSHGRETARGARERGDRFAAPAGTAPAISPPDRPCRSIGPRISCLGFVGTSQTSGRRKLGPRTSWRRPIGQGVSRERQYRQSSDRPRRRAAPGRSAPGIRFGVLRRASVAPARAEAGPPPRPIAHRPRSAETGAFSQRSPRGRSRPNRYRSVELSGGVGRAGIVPPVFRKDEDRSCGGASPGDK